MIDTEILQDYASEARELLDEMDNSLIRLEKEGGTPELLNNIFRAVHCIKGSAEYIGLERSSTLTHGVENLLDRLRERIIVVDASIIEFLFRAKDLILTLIDEVSRNHEEKTTISDIMEQLEVFLKRPATETDVSQATEPEKADENVAPLIPEPIPETAEAGDTEQPSPTEELPPAVTERLEEPEKSADAVSFSAEVFEEEEESSDEAGTLLVGELGEQDDVESAIYEEAVAVPEPEPTAVTSEIRPAQSAEETVPSLLNVSLYLDDLQDGLKPHEIMTSLIDAVRELIRSMEFLGMSQAAGILGEFETRVGSARAAAEPLAHEEIDRLRNLIYSLRPHYPEGVFPWNEPFPVEDAAPTAEITEGPSAFFLELAKIPELDERVIAAFEAAGYSTVEDLSRSDLATLSDIPGVERAAAEAVLKYLGVINAVTDWRPPRKTGKRSLLSDVDDELLQEFEGIFGNGEEPRGEHPTHAGNRAQDLLDELDAIGEDADREIMEIFLSYGWEIMDKLRPYAEKIKDRTADSHDLDACADLIKSIRSSSTYMDYQNLAAFLDEWFEKTLWCTQHIDSLDTQDFGFMEESLLRFEDFMRGLETMLQPDEGPADLTQARVSEPVAPAPVTAKKPVDRVRVSTVTPGETRFDGRPEAPAMPEPTTTEIPTEEYVARTAAKIEEAQKKAAIAAKTATDVAEPSPFSQDAPAAKDGPESAVVRTMRVDSAKVDILLNQVGELVVNRSYVEQLALELKSFHRILTSVRELGKKEIQSIKDLSLKVGEASVSLGRVATDLQEGVMKLRMLPIGQLFNRMPRLIRDLSRRVGKAVTLQVNGGDTEVDKRVIEQIYNPLVHLIRNAVDHGIEDTESRKNLGKKEEGTITLSAYSQGNQVIIDVEDDGAGINTAAVVQKAVDSQLIEPLDTKTLSAQDLYNLLFLPGFSTSKKVTRTSGRGVGMDVVKKDVEKINGHVEIESWEDQGTRISIKIPLTLAIIQTLLIRSSKHVFAIPLTSVREIIQVSPKEIITIEGFEVIKFRDETIPVLRVADVFKLKGHDPSRHPRFLVLAVAGLKTVGFLVEELIGEQDVVIKPLAEHVCETRGLAGSTILGDGTIALVLDVMEVIEDVIAQQRQIAQAGPRYAQAGRREGL
ncbi:MAG TPA: chemotaxis protein CheW [Desulfomonilaceae bacterium]|nr:chemotaxis protein CheW [Desulfomonilaceae bacterium]